MYEALLQVKYELGNASALVSWQEGGSPCNGTWLGVTCTSGVVTRVDLSFASLSGPLPASLAMVPSLMSLRLSDNSFSGTLPMAYSILSRLTELQVQSNALVGTLPLTYSTLQALISLNLANNQLSGTIPTSWPHGMTALTRLVLSNNVGMCGDIPGSWAGTSRVQFTGSNLTRTCTIAAAATPTGALFALRLAAGSSWPAAGLSGWAPGTDPCGPPAWSGVTCSGSSISAVDLSFQGLSGVLPTELQHLGASVTSLDLGNNAWGGPLPASLSALVGLRELQLANNALLSTIPTNYTAMAALTRLVLSGNTQASRLPRTRSQESALRFSMNTLE